MIFNLNNSIKLKNRINTMINNFKKTMKLIMTNNNIFKFNLI